MSRMEKFLGKSFPLEYGFGAPFTGKYFDVKFGGTIFTACIFTLSGIGSRGWVDVCIDQPGGYVRVTLSDDEISDYVDMKRGIPRIHRECEEIIILKAIEVLQNANPIS